jgi:hypothetical protein
LCVGGYAVVLLGGQVDVLGFKARKRVFDKGEGGVCGTVLDQDERLALGVDTGSVEGVAGYDLDVLGEVLFEGCDFWGFA